MDIEKILNKIPKLFGGNEIHGINAASITKHINSDPHPPRRARQVKSLGGYINAVLKKILDTFLAKESNKIHKSQIANYGKMVENHYMLIPDVGINTGPQKNFMIRKGLASNTLYKIVEHFYELKNVSAEVPSIKEILESKLTNLESDRYGGFKIAIKSEKVVKYLENIIDIIHESFDISIIFYSSSDTGTSSVANEIWKDKYIYSPKIDYTSLTNIFLVNTTIIPTKSDESVSVSFLPLYLVHINKDRIEDNSFMVSGADVNLWLNKIMPSIDQAHVEVPPGAQAKTEVPMAADVSEASSESASESTLSNVLSSSGTSSSDMVSGITSTETEQSDVETLGMSKKIYYNPYDTGIELSVISITIKEGDVREYLLGRAVPDEDTDKHNLYENNESNDLVGRLTFIDREIGDGPQEVSITWCTSYSERLG